MKKLSKRDMLVSCGIVPVKLVDGEPLFLLLRSRWFWDFPKGRKEGEETDLETALRETLEESAIPESELKFSWGRDYYETEPYRKKKDKVGRYFVAETYFEGIDLPVNPELGRPEHDAWKWVTYDEAVEMTNERIGKVLDWAYQKITNDKKG